MSTTTADPNSADTSGDPFSFLSNIAGDAVKGFGIYETATTAQAAAKKLNSSSLTYVILGLGGLAVVALFLMKR